MSLGEQIETLEQGVRASPETIVVAQIGPQLAPCVVVATDDASQSFHDVARELDVRLHSPRSSDAKHGVGPRQPSENLGRLGCRDRVLVPDRPATRGEIGRRVDRRVAPSSSIHASHRTTGRDRQHLGPEADTEERAIQPQPFRHHRDLFAGPIDDVTSGHRTR